MKTPYIVVVAGGTCSGKSTMCDKMMEILSQKTNIKRLSLDSYMMKEPPTVIAPITGIEYVEHNHPSGLYLDDLQKDFEDMKNSDFDVLLVEGLFALHLDFIRKSADFKIYVDLDSDARLVRRIKRHMQCGDTYEQVTDRYIDTVRFRHNELVEPTRWHADMVANGTLNDNKSIDVAVAYILSQLK